MASRILLVRHGEAAASWGQSADPGLSELGWRQADLVSSQLQALAGDQRPLLISSPLKRAQETAQPFSEAMDLPVAIDERVKEIPSPVPLAQRQTWLQGFMRQTWTEQPGALWDWRRGVVDAVSEPEGIIVVFTHFLVINALVGHCQGRENTLVFWPANTSVTELRRTGEELYVHELGEEMASRVN
ncbi:MAG: histidine phosphatase family protein [Pseudomonadota bacterium]